MPVIKLDLKEYKDITLNLFKLPRFFKRFFQFDTTTLLFESLIQIPFSFNSIHPPRRGKVKTAKEKYPFLLQIINSQITLIGKNNITKIIVYNHTACIKISLAKNNLIYAEILKNLRNGLKNSCYLSAYVLLY